MTAERKKYLKVAALSVLVSLLAGAVVILILGKNPLSAYYNLLQGVGLAPKAKYGGGQSMLTDLSSYIDYWTPMIFAALSYAVAMRCGLFNIGISGQMLIGGYKYDLPIGFLLAIAVMLLVKFVFDRTVFGFELRAVGTNRTASRYIGIHVGSRIVLSMAISGALAGLAGVTYYLGYVNSIQPRVLLSTGYDAIAVGLLGNNDPVGIFFASFLIEIISKGSTYLQSQAGLESEIADVITGLILLTSACNFYFMARMGRKEKQHAERN